MCYRWYHISILVFLLFLGLICFAFLFYSQFKDHEEFGGVVPERASRKHLEVIHHLISKALKEAGIDFKEIDYIAVSNYPGLLGSLLVGSSFAKAFAMYMVKGGNQNEINDI